MGTLRNEPWPCVICDFEFPLRAALEDHLSTHKQADITTKNWQRRKLEGSTTTLTLTESQKDAPGLLREWAKRFRFGRFKWTAFANDLDLVANAFQALYEEMEALDIRELQRKAAEYDRILDILNRSGIRNGH
jgi:gamma-glutamylcysteine synthetase